MTDRIHSLTVILNEDRRLDDVQPLIEAIYQLRNVAHVDVHTSDVNTRMAETRAKLEVRKMILDSLEDI